MRELGAQSSSEQHFMKQKLSTVLMLLLKSWILHIQLGFISEMNHSILSREFRVLKDSILARQTSRYIGDVRTLFGTSDHVERLIFPKDLFTETDAKKEIKDKYPTTPTSSVVSSPRTFFRPENATQQKIQKDKIYQKKIKR